MANSAVEKTISTQELKEKLLDVLHNDFQTTPEDASDQQVYEALSKIVVALKLLFITLKCRSRLQRSLRTWAFL